MATAEAVAHPDQEIDVRDAPDSHQGEGAAQLDAAEIDHRLPFADLGQAAGVLVVEWAERGGRAAAP